MTPRSAGANSGAGALRDRIRASVQARGSPTRQRSRAQGIVSRALAFLAIAGGLAAAFGLRQFLLRPFFASASIALHLLVGSATATGLTAPSSATSVMGRWRSDFLAAAGALPWLFSALFVHYGTYTEPIAYPVAPCATLTFVAGGLLASASFYARRRRVTHHSALHGAALAATAGLWASLLVGVACPKTEPVHVLEAHVAPVLLLIAAGGALGRRILAQPAGGTKFGDR